MLLTRIAHSPSTVQFQWWTFLELLMKREWSCFNAEERKWNFFTMRWQFTYSCLPFILSCQCAALSGTVIHFILSLVFTFIWWNQIFRCWKFRAVTNLINTIENMRKDWESPVVKPHEGEDFLFLFDLLSHSCGLELTLRMRTHSDENFYKICRPNFYIEDHLEVEEDKFGISWEPAKIEKWLNSGNTTSRSQWAIEIDSYEVAIHHTVYIWILQ